jgi:NADH-quinone oxidoreductase subunit A
VANSVPKGYFGEYLTLAFFAGMMVLLVAGTLGLNKLVSPKVHRDEKYLTYECGVDPVGGGWSQTQIRYYLFGLLFVVFDVEAVFLFPWAVVFDKLGTAAFVEMVIFIGILALGLAYAWRKKVLEWL